MESLRCRGDGKASKAEDRANRRNAEEGGGSSREVEILRRSWEQQKKKMRKN
jgi:hypothetical protein